MAKEGLGTKRVCPETGKKFYDLDKDPQESTDVSDEFPEVVRQIEDIMAREHVMAENPRFRFEVLGEPK